MRIHMIWLRRVIRSLLVLLVIPIAALLLYVTVAFTLPLFPANRQGEANDSDLAELHAFVISNGVHTDLVFPSLSPWMDWSAYFPREHFSGMPAIPEYVALDTVRP